MDFKMFWKKKQKPKYEYNVNVPFEIAFKALKEGYTIKSANYDDIYLVKVNDKVFNFIDRTSADAFEIDSLTFFEMFMDRWQIIEPFGANRFRRENK